uniref:Protein FMC1 homolog n=1 Tax=Attheya septentrionalis TaxID=420275 RepID=A0A7S2UB15_9STRA|mmetsp:Transcript_18044/g.32718  ORF Transcript_18044/g.32718 Transcript_18044/m.32718 type:complete len:125 (+) Transcript_18044:102-476(+)
MTASTTPQLHVLRGILRKMRPKPVSSSADLPNMDDKPAFVSSSKPFQKHVLEMYRHSASSTASPATTHSLRKLAYDYHMLRTNLVERARLHEMDGGAEVKLGPKEMSRRAAARAGLMLPEENAH